jgi:wyosine [tRNA(Phe)-imidazoG37] synthetase (radical SAM superfamily)
LKTINFHKQPIKFPPKNFVNKICLEPFSTIAVDLQGNVGLCGCEAWLPTRVGNIFQQSIGQILGSELAQDIRASITRGSYDYCNSITCNVISSDQLIGIENLGDQYQHAVVHPENWSLPKQIYLSGDATCNLTCPSCRTEIFKINEEQVEEQVKLGQILKNNLFSNTSDQPIELHVSTSGEVFASPLLLKFLSSIESEKFPNLRLWLQSNGLLAPRFWHKLGSMAHRVDNITVTVDAARGDTYEQLRRGGKWADILASLEWIKNKKIENGMSVHLRMVVQRDNIDQLLEFYELGQNYLADQIDYVRITNWGTYSEKEFRSIDVVDLDYPDRDHAMVKLQQIKHLPNVWLAGGL